MNAVSSAGNRMSIVALSGAFGLLLTSRKSEQLLVPATRSTGTRSAALFMNRMRVPLTVGLRSQGRADADEERAGLRRRELTEVLLSGVGPLREVLFRIARRRRVPTAQIAASH